MKLNVKSFRPSPHPGTGTGYWLGWDDTGSIQQAYLNVCSLRAPPKDKNARSPFPTKCRLDRYIDWRQEGPGNGARLKVLPSR